MMNVFRYPPPPATGEQPRMWKTLGVVAQSASGWVEAHYAIRTLHDDLDVDREHELRVVAGNLLHALTSQSGRTDIDPEAHYVVEHALRLHRIRLWAGAWNEPAEAFTEN